MKHYYSKFRLLATLLLLMVLSAGKLSAQILINEGFTTVLPTGWAQQNLSTPAGTNPTWFQGNTTVFNAYSGAATSYAAANYNSVAGDNTISNWMFTPTVNIANGNIITFWARSAGTYPDRLELRLSTNGASVNVGATNTSVGDYTTLLLTVNPGLTVAGFPTAWTQYSATISGVPTPTTGRFGFRYYVTNGGPAGANSNFIGVDEVIYGTPCSGTPTPGLTVSSSASVCSGIAFTLSAQNPPNGMGTTYQWQSSPDGTTWTNIAGATSPTLTTTQTVATYYRVQVTCSGNTGNSTGLQVTMNAPSSCYCTPPATNCNLSDVITNVTFGSTLNNTTTCSANGFANYTALPATTVVAGGANPMRVTVGPGGTEYVGVWIDYNDNGTFEASEFTLLGSGNGVTIAGNINIPASAPTGNHRMRVRVRFATTLTGADACLGYTYGETEDYTVNITPCVQGVFTTQPANTSIGCGNNATFSVAANGSLLSYQWEYRTSATGAWVTVTNGGVYSGATTNTLSVTNAPSSMNGYQYRAIISGACTALDFSNAATLTVTPYLAPISPVPAIKCQTSALQLFASPPPTVTSVCSPTLNLPILDGNITGVNNTLTVAGIPAGATITNVSVKLNVTHAYVADLMVVVKAPNGKILNLSNLIGGANNPGVNFTNTVFSSATGLPALSTGTSPGYTGTFRPDAAIAGAFGLPTGPTGFTANTAVYSDLFTQPNGAWTIAMYDAGPPDPGVLVNWCINITWGVAPATGIFSPTTNLFLDAAGTIPYTGTAVNSVYTTTTSNITYTATVSNGTCTSAPTAIPVTVTAPLTTVTVPATSVVCNGNNISIAATAATGTASVINYQWEVSTDGGTTYNTVSNGGVYSGATTGTLTITGAAGTLSNNRYRVKASIPACGSNITSAASVLTVNPTPVISIAASPRTSLFPGLTTTITATSNPAGATYSWLRNGTQVATGASNTYVVDVDKLGTYVVNVTDVNGCTGVSNSLTITDSTNSTFFIYPSVSANGQFQVRYFSEAGNNPLPRTLNIYDSKGARVYTRTFTISAPYTAMDVDLSNYSTGIYMVELGDRNGNRIKVGRVVIR